MGNIGDSEIVTAAPPCADGAVGMADAHWYAAVVNHNTEHKTAENLCADGFTAYVASQSEVRVRKSGRRVTVQRVVIPCIVFIHCTERRRLAAVANPAIFRFVTDRASRPNRYGKTVAIIPDAQIQRLRFMLGNATDTVHFGGVPVRAGQHVRVIRGSLRGLEGTALTASDGTTSLCIAIDMLGCAKVTIDPADIECIS